MNKYLFILLLIIPQVVFAQQEDNLELTFSSPKKSCVVKYKAESRGTGTYYHVLRDKEIEIYKGYFHYGPIVNWISNEVAELRMPSGSPNYNSFFYDCESKKLSPEYMLPIAADAINGTVATLNDHYYGPYYGKVVDSNLLYLNPAMEIIQQIKQSMFVILREVTPPNSTNKTMDTYDH